MFSAEKKQLEPRSGIPEIFATEIFRIDLVPGFRMKPIDAILWRHRQKAGQVVGTAGSDHDQFDSVHPQTFSGEPAILNAQACPPCPFLWVKI